MANLSYEHGAFDKPLIGETIGHNLERTVARVPDAEALVSCHQGVRYSYAEFNEAVDRLASSMLAEGLRKGDRVGVWSTNCAEWVLVQYATAKLGVVLVNINPSYRVSELEYALGQSGCRWIVAVAENHGSDFVAMVEQVRPRLSDLERAVFLDTPEWEQLVAGDDSYRDKVLAGMDELDFDDPINIQYTSGTTGFPKGATLTHHNILNNGYFIGDAARLHRARSRVYSGAAVPLLRNGARQPGRDHSRRLHRVPRRDVRPGRDASGVLAGALHEPVRRADDVHRRARPRALFRVRLRLAANRDHGRLALSCRGDEARQQRDGNRRDEHLLRHDRDVPGHHPDAARGDTRESLRHGRPGASARRSQDHRPGNRTHGAAR